MQQLQSRVSAAVYPGHVKFFRGRLLTSTPDDITALLDSMDKECRTIRNEALKMSWYMRGGLTYDQAMALSNDERKIISDLIKDNLETTKKSGLPFF